MFYSFFYSQEPSHETLDLVFSHISALHQPYYISNSEINVVCCLGSDQTQIEIQKGWCTAEMDSKV